MALKDALIGELKHESSMTKKMLERVPLDKKDWKPHEKSMTLGRLATHVAEIPHWVSRIVTMDEFDFLVQGALKNHTFAIFSTIQKKFNFILGEKMSEKHY